MEGIGDRMLCLLALHRFDSGALNMLTDMARSNGRA